MSDADVSASGADTVLAEEPRARTRQRLPRGMIVVGIILAAFVGYALYAGVGALRQHPVIGTVSRYQVTSDTRVTYRMTVTGPADTKVVCSVVARGDDYAIVGQVERTARIDSDGTIGLAGAITTLGRAANAEAGTCKRR